MSVKGRGICGLISVDGGTPYAVVVDPAICSMAVDDRWLMVHVYGPASINQ